mmetsp:Transcript_19729/g.54261  ORF Transcript_19729/g.54261 Transcript_19729/m.54261 type:complete len:414 (+) Transcript_19729:102-1343(+)
MLLRVILVVVALDQGAIGLLVRDASDEPKQQGFLALPALLQSHVEHVEHAEPTFSLLEAIAAEEFRALHGQTAEVLEDEESHAVYLCLMLVTFAGTTWVFWPLGVTVIARILLYLFSLSTMKIVVKVAFEYKFTFPRMLSAMHMLFSTVVGFTIMCFTSASVRRPTIRELCCQLLPLSIAFAWSLGASNQALVLVSAAFAEMIGATTPITSVALMMMLRMPFDLTLLIPVAIVIVGSGIAITGEVNFSAVGMLLCLGSNFGRSIKSVLQQRLMSGASNDAYDPVALLSWQCLLATFALFTWSSLSEGLAPYEQLCNAQNKLHLAIVIGVTCVNAVVLNLFAVYVVKDLGAVGNQVAGQVKSALMLAGAVAILHESITPRQIVGFIFVLAGAYMFARVEKGQLKLIKAPAPSLA